MPRFDYESESPLKEAGPLLAGVAACKRQNDEVLPLLAQLKRFEFFSLFSVDLLSSCSYMPTEEEPCQLEGCDIEPAEDVSEAVETRDLKEYEFELDSWARWDQPSDFSEYYDLRTNPEGNSGYDGSRVWRFIHQKISFQIMPSNRSSEEVAEWIAAGRPDQPLKSRNGWKRDFNRLISGFHSAVSAHIVNDLPVEQQLDEYRRRLRDEPGASVNLYFAYMLCLCAIKDAAPRLNDCNYLGAGSEVRPIMQALTGSSLLSDASVQKAAENLRQHAQSDRCELWQARMRMRDLLRVMNCVQCNLCRLHGKVTALGLAAALRVLLGAEGRGEDPYVLNRVEVGALVATAAKLGGAIEIVEQLRASCDGDQELAARQMFDRFDVDRSGLIDASELRGICVALGLELAEGQEQELLRQLDIAGTGQVSYDEFLWWWRSGLSFEALADRENSRATGA